MRSLTLFLIIWHAFGCANRTVNPSFNVSCDDAEKILDRVEKNPRHLDRPLVIVGGFNDPGLGPLAEQAWLGDSIDGTPVLRVTIMFESSLGDCRKVLIDEVNRKFPGKQVDVIGISMGGLVARHAAAPIPGKPRLNVARMFTISAPHDGAVLAKLPTFDQKVVDMRPGSKFLAELAKYDGQKNYELIPYVRLRDKTVGAQYAAPAGATPWWVDTPPFQPAHVGALFDPRITADIVLRLRNEQPLTHNPPAPLPDESTKS